VKEGILIYRGNAEGNVTKSVVAGRQKRSGKLRRGLGR
jgi:hypothetical protein